MNFVGSRSFPEVLAELGAGMLVAPRVENGRWQGVDVSDRPDARMYELRSVCFEVDLGGCEDLGRWRREIGPNLPWADDHFLERVGGTVLNPGEQWKNWPWGRSADKFRTELPEELGPRFPPQDWAYLAGMIDGEGSIAYRPETQPTFQGRVMVAQKDRRVLDWIVDNFRVGKVRLMPTRDLVAPSGYAVHQDGQHEWYVYGVATIKWVLTGVLPYLRVKREKAELVLRAIEEADVNISSPKSHRKRVWNQQWPARFNHSYADRLWPKRLEGGSAMLGHRGEYGDLSDLVQLLVRDPHTRQAWIPLFHPEDTGWSDGGRKPCTLGYQMIRRGDRLSIWYPLRSCDFVRHLRDDLYLAVRMLLWVLDRCRDRDRERWAGVVPGDFGFHATSLHWFENDRIRALRDASMDGRVAP